MIKIAITTGDPDGIGTEITAKALSALAVQKTDLSVANPDPVCFFIWRSPHAPIPHLQLIDQHYTRHTVTNFEQAIHYFGEANFKNSLNLIDINSSDPAAHWVEQAARACHSGHMDALVTGPLSKTSIHQSGLQDMGHTGILSRVCGKKNLLMGFIGENFNVVLATGHIPLEQVTTQITIDNLKTAVRSALELTHVSAGENKPIALLGLNPHAGEEGLIGDTELKVHIPLIKNLRQHEGIQIEGPLVPDAAFLPEFYSKYSVYIANYHDQGLIPFKAYGRGKAGVHITLGLPFIRTSVDHGTAKEIFNLDRADSSSMQAALACAIKLAMKLKFNQLKKGTTT